MENEVKPALSMFATVQEYKDAVKAFDANLKRRAEDAERLPAEKLEWEACVCGEPSTAGTTHRTDGPCYVTEPAAPAVDAAKLDDLGKLVALAIGVPEHIQLKGWYVEAPRFGHQHVYADNFKGHGRQHIATLPAAKSYFGTMADFIAAANPAAILRIAALVAQQAARIAELETAIGFYADLNCWLPDSRGHFRFWMQPNSSARTAFNGYELARQVLDNKGGQ